MKITFEFEELQCSANLAKPLDISLPISNVIDNPNCYWAEPVKFETIYSGDFVGSVAEGGTVNYQKLTLTPHGNGTHTECFGHITDNEAATIHDLLKQSHFVSELITLTPQPQGEDLVVTFEEFRNKWINAKRDALILRTLPNDKTKRSRHYSGQNPPYLDYRIAEFLYQEGIAHLVLDLPSVDKEVDGGELKAHKAFWGLTSQIRKTATITELAYIDNKIKDGTYLLNLQTINIRMDASPSRPVLFEITGI